MPERPRIHRYSEEKRRAASLFVDRAEPQALFRGELDLLVDARPRPSLLTFYGVSGQGKTALCHQFMRVAREEEIVKRGVRCAHIDLQLDSPSGEWHAFVAIRNAVAAATGATFPCFDLAFADFWSRAAPHQPEARLGAGRLSGFGADASDTVASSVAGLAKDGVSAALDGWAKTVADVAAEVAGGLPFVGPLLKRTSNWAISAGYQALIKHNAAALEGLYGNEGEPAASVVLAHLPDILAHELALHLKAKKQQLVLLVDEYERAMLGGGSEGTLRSDPWDQGLRAFYASCALGQYQPREGKGYTYDVPLLLVLFGREKIRWDEIDNGWKDDLTGRQHILDGLAAKDAQQFLTEAGIAAPALRDQIVTAATAFDPLTGVEAAYPLMLDMSVQLYFDMLAGGEEPRGEDFVLSSTTYDAKRGELLQRILRRYPVELHGLLRRLACVREFDRDVAVQLIRAFNLPFDILRFSDVQRLSFISRSDDDARLAIHSHIRETLIASLPVQDLHETRAMLADLYFARATAAAPRSETHHARAYAEAIILHADGNLAEGNLFTDPLTQMFNSLLLTGSLVGALRHAVRVERSREGNWNRLVEALHHLAWVQAKTRHADEAIDSATEAMALLSAHAPEDRERYAKNGYLLATAHNALGNREEALAAFQACLTIRERIFPAESDVMIATTSGVASGLEGLGRRDEAIALNMSLLNRLRLIDPNHPFICRLSFNLGVSLFRADNLAEAKARYEEALQLAECHMAHDDPLIGRISSNLGLIAIQEDRFDEAETLFDRNVAISRSNAMSLSPYTCLGLAKVYRARGEYRAMLDVVRAIPADGLPSERLITDAVYDAAYIEVQGLAACESEEAAIVRCEEAILGAHADASLHKLTDLLGLRAEFHIRAGEIELAIARFRDQLEIRKTLFLAPSIWNARPLRDIGRLHLQQQNWNEANVCLSKARAQFLGAVGAEDAETREASLLAGFSAYMIDDHERAIDTVMPILESEARSPAEIMHFRTSWSFLSDIYAERKDRQACARAENRAEYFDSLLAPEILRPFALADMREINRVKLDGVSDIL